MKFGGNCRHHIHGESETHHRCFGCLYVVRPFVSMLTPYSPRNVYVISRTGCDDKSTGYVSDSQIGLHGCLTPNVHTLTGGGGARALNAESRVQGQLDTSLTTGSRSVIVGINISLGGCCGVSRRSLAPVLPTNEVCGVRALWAKPRRGHEPWALLILFSSNSCAFHAPRATSTQTDDGACWSANYMSATKNHGKS